MQHLDEGTIHSWLDGALSPEEAARVAAHVAECPQCAAAVAEARGFIAASSRILTALDSAPRGVIPVAAPIRHRNWPMWRAAAAVLVVAGGSLVVIRNTGRESPVPAPAYDSASSNAITSRALVIGESMRTTSEPTAPVKIQGSLSQRTAAGS
ncbi:MAG TPA: zf-HC2 domain-containing protein, partial [Gemmatimonadaceae bacterium]|nr:zf-HC2 domain-containing protein [Gemmatimonadaceae bacterium]